MIIQARRVLGIPDAPAPAPEPAPEAADMTAYDDDGSEAPTLTRDDGAAAGMGAVFTSFGEHTGGVVFDTTIAMRSIVRLPLFGSLSCSAAVGARRLVRDVRHR